MPESAENEASSDADGNAVETLAARPGQVLVSTQTITHEYLTLNGKVARETVKNNGSVTDVMDFIYDESGRPFALNYSEDGGSSFTTYYYILNLQGDVVKLISYIPDFEYTEVASYEYDAWGNILSQSGSMAEKNPLRYRGYYYDTETGFYYLQSRYYDPANRRFVNADAFASTGQGFIGTNMFAYCNNTPVAFSDPTGHSLRPTTVVISDCVPRRYIDNQQQSQYASLAFGDSTVSEQGCGAVAVSNILTSRGIYVSFPKILSFINEERTKNGVADYGMSIAEIKEALNNFDNRITYETIQENSQDVVDYPSVIICVAYYDCNSGMAIGGHVFAGSKLSNGKYYFYNSGLENLPCMSFEQYCNTIDGTFTADGGLRKIVSCIGIR